MNDDRVWEFELGVESSNIKEIGIGPTSMYAKIAWRLRDFPWVSTKEELPPDGIPVLILFHDGTRKIAELRWDRPSHEDTYQAYRYWDDPDDDGQTWEWNDITHWTVLPPAPKEIQVEADSEAVRPTGGSTASDEGDGSL